MDDPSVPPPPSPPPSPPDSSKTESPITHSDEWWFWDGTIVVIAEDTAYRVHKGVLSLHSEVFKDMFQIGQQSSAETFEDCPMVHVSDTASDFSLILKIIYFGGQTCYLEKDSVLELSTIQTMFVLGRKYNIPYIHRDALRRLHIYFPTTLREWDSEQSPITPRRNPRDGTRRPSIEVNIISMIRLFKVARMFDDLRFVLPMTMLWCAVLQPRQIIMGIEDKGDVREVFTLEEQDYILRFKEDMNQVIRGIPNIFHNIVRGAATDPSRRFCDAFGSCGIPGCDIAQEEYIKSALSMIEGYKNWSPLQLWRKLIGIMECTKESPAMVACKGCEKRILSALKMARNDAWNAIGIRLEVPDWGELPLKD
ncbi:hypothetical protein C8Q75DRAFT_810354 [Abortiporus biennis]|nr:hypothetical protein C8Q75DRAFT_810354 [Abortiporus biennis]